jgi:cation diffusion facilitator family transporter
MTVDGAGDGDAATKRNAAALSVASNMTQIALKLIAGIATGSVSILTEAAHSATDLIASLVALVSVRKADEPADADHLYGHAKVENVAAAIEGVLILFGAAIITYESIKRLINGSHVHTLGLGIAVIAISAVANTFVSIFVGRRARETDSPALEGDAAHLTSDAGTSVAVLLGLIAVQVTGATWIDPAVALVVAAAIVVAGVRILRRSSRALVDEALPEAELETIRAAVVEFGGEHGVVGYHRLRARRAGSERHVDLHVQFAAGTTLEEAHRTAHALQARISSRLGGADILIHLEPEDRVQPGTEIPVVGPPPRGG